MSKNSTTNDLILYLYNETLLTKTVLIQQDIDHNPHTAEEFEDLKRARALLDQLLQRPSEHCIDNIMAFSRLIKIG